MIRIKEAIKHFNENVKDEGMPKMNGKVLGALTMESNGAFYISNWGNGKHLGKLKPEHIVKMCELTGVDANFLYGIKPMFQSLHLGGGESFAKSADDVVIVFNKENKKSEE